jgi:hypothetical protein
MQRGHDVHVLDLATTGLKPELVRALGATYHSRPASELGLHPSIVVECTGVAPLIRGATETAAAGGIVCLTGVAGPVVPVASATTLLTDVVLKNLPGRQRHCDRRCLRLRPRQRRAHRSPDDRARGLEEGVPDGLTVDSDGNLWVAVWGGGELRRYSPTGALLSVLPVPVERPTSCAFGGPDSSTLFFTSARDGLDDEAVASQPDAGRYSASIISVPRGHHASRIAECRRRAPPRREDAAGFVTSRTVAR